jgi:CheY-like chemotaxis protein
MWRLKKHLGHGFFHSGANTHFQRDRERGVMSFFPWSRQRTVREVAKPLSSDARKRLTRIVVIDDEPDSVPVEDLRTNGYSVEYWEILNAARLARLERGEFDIVILDIQGIVPPGFSDTGDGLGVLRRLKRANPSQIVVACSGQSYRIDAMDFYRSADGTLAKPISAIRAMETLDELIQSRIGAGQYWDGVANMLREAGVDDAKIRKLENRVAKAAEHSSSLSQSQVESIVGHVGTVVTIAELVNKAISFARGGP